MRALDKDTGKTTRFVCGRREDAIKGYSLGKKTCFRTDGGSAECSEGRKQSAKTEGCQAWKRQTFILDHFAFICIFILVGDTFRSSQKLPSGVLTFEMVWYSKILPQNVLFPWDRYEPPHLDRFEMLKS